MRVSIVGSGYVGTTIAGCLADLGHEVVNVEIDESIVESINSGNSPIHEPGLDELIGQYGGDELAATTDYKVLLDTEITFLALPTPSKPDGSIDTSIIENAAKTVGETLAKKDGDHVVITKSTVIPTTTKEILAPILSNSSGKEVGDTLHIGVNPEFLREGTAVQDFKNPHKLVFGTDDKYARESLYGVFDPLLQQQDVPVVETGTAEAEMIKYANNAFLATKISLINEIGNICKEYGVDIYEVANAIGLDPRIGEQFLRSGVGWGGSCFPKDIGAIIAAAKSRGYEPSLLEAAVGVNENQPERLLQLLDEHVDVADKRVAVLGLAFKPGTDDVRNSRAIPIINGLKQRNAKIVAYDPVAMKNMRERFPEIEYVNSAANALRNAVGAVVVTDWDEFAALDDEFDEMDRPVVVDGRRVIKRREGIVYEGLTW